MATAVPNYLEGQTYVPVRKYDEGTYFDETKAGTTLKDAVSDIDNLVGVALFDGGIVKDVSTEAARLWFELNSDQVDSVFDIPPFIHEHLHNEVYADIQESRYQADAYFAHENSLAGRLG